MRIVGVDPGGSTGLCSLEQSGDPFDGIEAAYLLTSTLQEDNHHKELWSYLFNKQPDIVVCERFEFRERKRGPKQPLKDLDLRAREYIGVVKLYAQRNDVKLVMQMQLAHDNGLWTDEKLKDLGLYKPAHPHEMDALRHVLYYITITLKDQRWMKKWKATQ